MYDNYYLLERETINRIKSFHKENCDYQVIIPKHQKLGWRILFGNLAITFGQWLIGEGQLEVEPQVQVLKN